MVRGTTNRKAAKKHFDCLREYAPKSGGAFNHKTKTYNNQTYVLLSALEDEDGIVPVKITVLKYNNRNEHKIHVLITTETIKKEAGIVTEQYNNSIESVTPTSVYKLAYILTNIKNNSNANTIGEYIPDWANTTLQKWRVVQLHLLYFMDSNSNSSII